MATYDLVLTPEAIAELQEAIRYYNSQQNGLGQRFYKDMSGQLDLLMKNPFIKAIRYDDVRFALGDVFPYAIHYTVDEEKSVIIVHAVLSHWQRPRS